MAPEGLLTLIDPPRTEEGDYEKAICLLVYMLPRSGVEGQGARAVLNFFSELHAFK